MLLWVQMEDLEPRICSESGIRERRAITPDGDDLPTEVFLCASRYRSYCLNLGICAIGGGYREPLPAEVYPSAKPAAEAKNDTIDITNVAQSPESARLPDAA